MTEWSRQNINMKTKNIEFLHEILTEQMNHWLLFPCALTIWGITERYTAKVGPILLLWVLCGLFPFLFFIIRSRFDGFFKLILLQLAVAAPGTVILFLLDRTILLFIHSACAVGYMVFSLIIYLNDDKPDTIPLHPVVGMLLSAFSILLLRYQNISGWDLYFVVPLVAALALYALTLYIRQYMEFLAVNSRSAGHLPAAEMFRSGFLLVSGFVLSGAVILLIFANVGNYGPLWTTIKRWLRDSLRSMFSGLPRSDPNDLAPLTEAEMEPTEIVPQITEISQPALIWQIFEIAAYVVVSCFLAFCLIVFLFRMIQFFRLRFTRSVQGRKPEQEFEPDLDVREKCGIERIAAKRRNLSELLSPAQRIRRLYKKRILASAQELAEGSRQRLRILTPRECGRRLEEEQMAQIYEQVRYSNSEATADTLRQMKNALRHRGHSLE